MAFGSLGSIWSEIGLDCRNLDKGLMQATTKLAATDKTINTFGQKLTASSTKLITTGAIMAGAIAASLLKVANDFDNAYDKIRASTGKTGEAFKGLQDDFRAVAKDTPATFGNISTAVSILNARLDLTGKELQARSKQLLELSRITETEVNANVDIAAQLFNNWNIATADQAETLDYMFRATQQTGIGITELMADVTGTGPILRAMGFDIDYSAALLASFNKAGVETSSITMAMKIALKNMAKEGFTDPQEALNNYIERIKSAKTDIEATGIAAEVFGGRAGPVLAKLIREGRFEIDNLVKSLKTGSDTILKAAADTYDLKAAMQQLKNDAMIAIEPYATKFFNKLIDITKAFNDLDPATQKTIASFLILGTTSVAGVLLLAGVVGKLRSAILLLNASMLANPLFLAGATIASTIFLTGDSIQKFGDKTEEAQKQIKDFSDTIAISEQTLRKGKNAQDEFTKATQALFEEITKTPEIFDELNPKIVEINKNFADGKITQDEARDSIIALTKEYKLISPGMTRYTEDMGRIIASTVESKIATQDHENAVAALAAQYPNLTKEEVEAQVAQDEITAAMNEGSESADNQTKSIDDLISSFNNLMKTLFGGITTYNDFQEANWALEDAQKVLTEAIKKYGEGSREAEQAQNDLDDTMIASVKTAFELSQSIKVTTEEQEEARKKAIELGLQYVNTGAISAEAFMSMASQFSLSSADIIKFADDMNIEIDNATRIRFFNMDYSAIPIAVKKVGEYLSELKDKNITITTTYKEYKESYYSTISAGKVGGAMGGIVGYSGGGIIGQPIPTAASGMVVPQTGRAIPILAHEYEAIINTSQQRNLAEWIMGKANSRPDGGGGKIIENLNIYSPEPLTPSEVARQTRNTLRLAGLVASL